LAWLVGAACHSVPEKVRQATYPPEFVYITRQQLDFTMWRLARDVRELDQLLRAPAPIDGDRRGAIVAHLTSMETAAADLKSQPGWHSNQPAIDTHLGRFEADIARARRAVEAEPPNYYLAGFVSGACLYCHGGTGE
jgi:hypothetical protein